MEGRGVEGGAVLPEQNGLSSDKTAGRFLDILVIDRLYLDLLVASEDAAATATDYGKACAILYPALSLVKGRVKVRKSRLNIAPDFLREKSGNPFGGTGACNFTEGFMAGPATADGFFGPYSF